MAGERPKLRFLLDNNVPDSVGKYLQRRGHSVVRQRFCEGADAPDPVVAMTAINAERILVTQDKDFNGQRFRQPRFARLSRIGLSGPGPTLLPAVKAYIDLIEFQFHRKLKTGRAVAHVAHNQIRFVDH